MKQEFGGHVRSVFGIVSISIDHKGQSQNDTISYEMNTRKYWTDTDISLFYNDLYNHTFGKLSSKWKKLRFRIDRIRYILNGYSAIFLI